VSEGRPQRIAALPRRNAIDEELSGVIAGGAALARKRANGARRRTS
jgi:hypothetical protein